MIADMPKIGTLVRRKRDDQLYKVGRYEGGGIIGNVWHECDVVRLVPVWGGRAHSKTVTHFLDQYKLEAE